MPHRRTGAGGHCPAREIDTTASNASWLILDLQRVIDVDPTGARSLLLAAKRLHSQQRSLSLVGANGRVERVLQAMGLETSIAPVRWFVDQDTALEAHEDIVLREGGDQGESRSLSFLQTALAEGLTYAQGKLLQNDLVQRSCDAGERIFRTGDACSSLLVTGDSVVGILLPMDSGRCRHQERRRRLGTDARPAVGDRAGASGDRALHPVQPEPQSVRTAAPDHDRTAARNRTLSRHSVMLRP